MTRTFCSTPRRTFVLSLAACGMAASAAIGAAIGTAAAAAIPARPEQIQFPALKYQPPRAADYRVKLSNGMVAYLVPERDQPLVNVTVVLRLGPDLDPAGKEGAVATMVHLLTRGGTTTKTAAQIEDRLAYLGATLDSQIGGGGSFTGGGVPITGSESTVTLNLLAKDPTTVSRCSSTVSRIPRSRRIVSSSGAISSCSP
jgi:hypothetical protein